MRHTDYSELYSPVFTGKYLLSRDGTFGYYWLRRVAHGIPCLFCEKRQEIKKSQNIQKMGRSGRHIRTMVSVNTVFTVSGETVNTCKCQWAFCLRTSMCVPEMAQKAPFPMVATQNDRLRPPRVAGSGRATMEGSTWFWGRNGPKTPQNGPFWALFGPKMACFGRKRPKPDSAWIWRMTISRGKWPFGTF